MLTHIKENEMKTKDLIKKINKLIPEAKAVRASDFYNDNSRDGIWFRGSEDYASDGLLIFDYYEEYAIHSKIHPTLEKILTDAGWYGEPYDAGTLMAWRM
jgi:hypothetical protein